ncbi:uncharacterized protein LOC122572973 [Bombus pyrosoma]|uniref:uncharacterized protein LOC122572973 n=1 Tax=Bombus pyrosoma TaxID=396416 RepID=UPI001CB9925F|nr:uncharacterized protein LOC122572973 [Bombus pyrosoma]
MPLRSSKEEGVPYRGLRCAGGTFLSMKKLYGSLSKCTFDKTATEIKIDNLLFSYCGMERICITEKEGEKNGKKKKRWCRHPGSSTRHLIQKKNDRSLMCTSFSCIENSIKRPVININYKNSVQRNSPMKLKFKEE